MFYDYHWIICFKSSLRDAFIIGNFLKTIEKALIKKAKGVIFLIGLLAFIKSLLNYQQNINHHTWEMEFDWRLALIKINYLEFVVE